MSSSSNLCIHRNWLAMSSSIAQPYTIGVPDPRLNHEYGLLPHVHDTHSSVMIGDDHTERVSVTRE